MRRDLFAALDSHMVDCLLLDLHMPGINGFDVLGAFQVRHIPTPIIVITAHDEPGTADRVMCSALRLTLRSRSIGMPFSPPSKLPRPRSEIMTARAIILFIISGWSLYVKDGKPTFYYNFFEGGMPRSSPPRACLRGKPQYGRSLRRSNQVSANLQM